MKTCGVCVCVFICVCAHTHVCVFVYVFALCVVWHIFTEGCVCYPCLLESDLRLCLIGVFTLSGLTHTDMLDLGSPPSAMKRENSDTETCLPLCWEDKLYSDLFLCLAALSSSFLCSLSLLQETSPVFSPFEKMNFSTLEAWWKRHRYP